VAASSTPAAFITALKTALAARFAAHGTLSAVRVDIIPTGDTSSIDAVTLLRGPVVGGQEPGAFGKKRRDAYEIPGVIFTYDTGADSDVAFQASWDKAALILDELILLLRDNDQLTGDELGQNRVTDIQYEAQFRDQGGWVTRCEYTIEYAALVA
jgi:hypothetical protein